MLYLLFTFKRIIIFDLRRFGATKSAQNISAQVKIGEEKKRTNFVVQYSALIKKKFVCEANSFAFNGNLLRWEHDCIFALPLRLSVDHYYKQVISAQSQ